MIEFNPEVQVVPPELRLTLVPGRSAKGRFRILDTREPPFALRAVSTSSAGIDVAVIQASRAGHEFEVTVRDDNGIPPGHVRAGVTVYAAGTPGQQWEIPVLIHKVPRLRVTPPSLRLTPSGEGAEGVISVADIEGEDVALEAVEASQGPGVPAVEANFGRESGRQRLITIRTPSIKDFVGPVTLTITAVRPCRQVVEVVLLGPSSPRPR